MTWTATEHQLAVELLTVVSDEDGDVVCRLRAYDNDPAAIEEMRARARLIVQAEAMREVLREAAEKKKYGPQWRERARAIIAATEQDNDATV